MIAQDDAALSLMGIETDEARATIRSPNRSAGQRAPDSVGFLVPGVLHHVRGPHLKLVVGAHRERHQLVQRHAILGINSEQGRGYGRQFQALFDDLRGDEEDPRNCFVARTLLAQSPEGADFTSGSRATRYMFSASESSSARISDEASRTKQGTGAVFASRFCFTKSDSGRP